MIPQYIKSSIIRVDSYSSKIMTGSLVNSYFEEERPFSSYIELIFILEEFADDIDYPQSSTAVRQFNEKRKSLRQTGKREFVRKEGIQLIESMAEISEVRGELATFSISILSRHNSDWQGNILWIEKKESHVFRSSLELAKLIDSVLINQKLAYEDNIEYYDDEDFG